MLNNYSWKKCANETEKLYKKIILFEYMRKYKHHSFFLIF